MGLSSEVVCTVYRESGIVTPPPAVLALGEWDRDPLPGLPSRAVPSLHWESGIVPLERMFGWARPGHDNARTIGPGIAALQRLHAVRIPSVDAVGIFHHVGEHHRVHRRAP